VGSKRRLLVIGASPMRHAAFVTWRSMGLDVVLVDGHSPERYEELAHEFHALDARDGRADLVALEHIARTCDGITTVADDSQLTVARVAETVHRPGVGCTQAAIARSKPRQRAACAAAGMRVPRWREITTPDDLRAFYEEMDGPAVLKPVDGGGGAGAMRVSGLDEALSHWPVARALSTSRTAVAEEFLHGREVCVDAVVWDHQVRFLSVVDCEHMQTFGFLCTAASYASVQPDHERATQLVEEIIDAIDLSLGIIHAEFKIEGSTWTTVEFGLRPGGAFVPELTVKVAGVDLYEAQARLALGDEPLGPPVAVTAPFAQARYLVGEGVVRRFVPPATILERFNDVRVVNQQIGAGQRARVPVSEAGRAGYAYGWGDDRERLDSQLRGAIALLGHEMGVVVHGNDVPDDDRTAASLATTGGAT